MFFEYGDGDGWQAIIKCKHGEVSVRLGSPYLFTTKEKPFECRYNGDVWPAQDEKDVYFWIKTGKILSEIESTERIEKSGKGGFVNELISDIVKKFNIPSQKLGISVSDDELKRYLDREDGIQNED